MIDVYRVEGFKVEDMIKRSFSEFSTQKLAPEQKNMLARAENVMKTLGTCHNDIIIYNDTSSPIYNDTSHSTHRLYLWRARYRELSFTII